MSGPAPVKDCPAVIFPFAPVAVLCARADSLYKNFPGCEVFDEHRDARTFGGGCPVVAHPPCRLFGQLRHFVKLQGEEKEREIELGIWCARQVQNCGGVLEHPARSILWQLAGLPKPGETDLRGGFTLAMPQWWFGHLALKATWFYCCGIARSDLPEIPLILESDTHRPVEDLSHRQREMTPPALAGWLIETARRARGVEFAA